MIEAMVRHVDSDPLIDTGNDDSPAQVGEPRIDAPAGAHEVDTRAGAHEVVPTEPTGRGGGEGVAADVVNGDDEAERAAGERRRHSDKTTRDRILDIALDLFIEQGFDKTSLRQIADRLGFTKAAIYYHFASKDEILMALHLRLHDFGRRAMQQIGQMPAGLESWGQLLDDAIGEMLANSKIFVMHEVNRAALENLHRLDHEQEHTDMVEVIRRTMGDAGIPLRDRVRLACAIGAIMAGLTLSGKLLEDVSADELRDQLRSAVRDLLRPEPAPAT
jgi:AcrR family transcriptional regulator